MASEIAAPMPLMKRYTPFVQSGEPEPKKAKASLVEYLELPQRLSINPAVSGLLAPTFFLTEYKLVQVSFEWVSMLCYHAHTGPLNKEEVMFLTDASVVDHPSLVIVIGYCCDEQVRGVVYDLDPVDTLHNMVLKVALGFARLLEFLHGHDKPYLVFNIDACHIMLDQEFNPILFDFGLMSGGIIGELSYPKKFIYMSLGYVDPFFVDTGMQHDLSCDVFSYGVILIELIAKIVIDLEKSVKLLDLPDERAKLVYKPGFSLIQESLEKDPGYDATDGPMITNLAMRCVEYYPENRPTMKEVVEQLEGLRVVKLHGDGLGPSN
ncbi:hypothetical protein RHMOL_Rhmol04G0316200 [Rhododendron molle]|uniref:Uncharacterized protein n=1 Tax=Rhododendron molle TaxID=49168 RepID=A0ACC0P8X2_RHOML|nr:hypothetical protein RHMOL_Rhmol04G0316200 [Rhododendron molle]